MNEYNRTEAIGTYLDIESSVNDTIEITVDGMETDELLTVYEIPSKPTVVGAEVLCEPENEDSDYTIGLYANYSEEFGYDVYAVKMFDDDRDDVDGEITHISVHV